MKLFATLSLSAIIALLSTPQMENLTADQIIGRMMQTYRECDSYQDSGNVHTIFFEQLGQRTVDKPFKTAFIRTGGFRFEYNETSFQKVLRYIVWTDGKQVQTWWDARPGIQAAESLSLAIAGATGVSGGSAPAITGFLYQGIGWPGVMRLGDPKRLLDGQLDGRAVFRIEGSRGTGDRWTWSIDKQTFMLLRAEGSHEFPNFRTETTMTFSPRLNQPVGDDALAFNPPGNQ